MRDPATPDAAGRRAGYSGLIIPFGLAAMTLLLWSIWWIVLAGRIGSRVDGAVADLRGHGYEVGYVKRTVSGWPFRTFVRFETLHLRAPSGQALDAAELGAEANAYDPTHWVIAAPKGLVWTRGQKGAVAIGGEALRASISGLDRSPPRIVVELRKPVFTPAVGAEPFPLASADLVDFYVEPRADAADEGRFLFRIVGGMGRRGGILDWVAGGQRLSTEWSGVLTHVSALKGPTWPQAVRAWSRRGGDLVEVTAKANAGSEQAVLESTRLEVSGDGRLRGGATLKLVHGPEALIGLGRSGKVDPSAAALAAATAAAGDIFNGRARLKLSFDEDGSRLGPVRLAPAPRLF